MKTSDFDYQLPPELIAQKPLEPRDQSRLLVVDRQTGSLQHSTFAHLPNILEPGDLLVCNDSRVVPARLVGRKEGTGGKVEMLLLRRMGDGLWEVLLKPARRFRPGSPFQLLIGPTGATEGPAPSGSPRLSNSDSTTLVAGQVVERTDIGTWLVRFFDNPDLDTLGRVPLPPYVREPLDDPERYQTVYARAKGSVAAPTAGLHFTPQLIKGLSSTGIGLTFLTVHIGLDTFRPVAAENPGRHPIHAEWGKLSESVAGDVNGVRCAGRRVVAVGTSSVRLLETSAAATGKVEPFSGWTRLFILPGHRFRAVDAMLTNFHLPRTTLLMLVSAFAGRDLILEAYQEAIRERYRFYSFGDVMLIL